MSRARQELNDPERGRELGQVIRAKSALRAWYEDVYSRYRACIARTPSTGVALEIGSGGGFAAESVPELVTSDIIPYPGIHQVVDATSMPFRSESLRFIGMLNVFHHIPDAEAFLSEAQRCLLPNGRMLIVDQHRGIISTPILKYLHHEPFDSDAVQWQFRSTGPLSGANGALAWIVFKRDRERLRREFPRLEVVTYTTHSPLGYWLAGGLKPWSLIGRRSYPAAAALDRVLTDIAPNLGSFVDVEIRKR